MVRVCNVLICFFFVSCDVWCWCVSGWRERGLPVYQPSNGGDCRWSYRLLLADQMFCQSVPHKVWGLRAPPGECSLQLNGERCGTTTSWFQSVCYLHLRHFLCGFLWFSQRAWSIIWVRRNLSCWTIWKTSVPCPSCPTACGSDAVLQAVCLNLACRGPFSSSLCQHPVIQPQLYILSRQIFKVSYCRCPWQWFFFKCLQIKFWICAFD